LGLWGDLHGPWHSVHVWEAWPKTCRFYIFRPFSWAIVHSFGFSRCFSTPWHLVLVWYTWPKTHRFCVYVRFCELLPTIWGSGGFTWPMTLTKCLRSMTKTPSFLCFWAVSWAIAHSFGFLGQFIRNMTICTCLSGMTKNSWFLRFRAVFMSYCP
jgi:hypothetical protein